MVHPKGGLLFLVITIDFEVIQLSAMYEKDLDGHVLHSNAHSWRRFIAGNARGDVVAAALKGDVGNVRGTWACLRIADILVGRKVDIHVVLLLHESFRLLHLRVAFVQSKSERLAQSPSAISYLFSVLAMRRGVSVGSGNERNADEWKIAFAIPCIIIESWDAQQSITLRSKKAAACIVISSIVDLAVKELLCGLLQHFLERLALRLVETSLLTDGLDASLFLAPIHTSSCSVVGLLLHDSPEGRGRNRGGSSNLRVVVARLHELLSVDDLRFAVVV